MKKLIKDELLKKTYIKEELNILKPTVYNYRLNLSDGEGNKTKTISIDEKQLNAIKELLTK